MYIYNPRDNKIKKIFYMYNNRHTFMLFYFFTNLIKYNTS